jgi:hypothetical protein
LSETPNYADGYAIREAIERRVKEIGDSIERACEQSIQEGRNGVLVEKLGDEWRITPSHPDVPFGAIYERTS